MTTDHDDHSDEPTVSDAAVHSDAPGTAHDPDAHQGGDPAARVTSPMQRFSMGQVGTGFLVLLVGLAVAYVLPALF